MQFTLNMAATILHVTFYTGMGGGEEATVARVHAPPPLPLARGKLSPLVPWRARLSRFIALLFCRCMSHAVDISAAARAPLHLTLSLPRLLDRGRLLRLCIGVLWPAVCAAMPRGCGSAMCRARALRRGTAGQWDLQLPSGIWRTRLCAAVSRSVVG